MRWLLRAARINFAQHWKKGTIPIISDWELTFGEYTAMAKTSIQFATVLFSMLYSILEEKVK